MAGRKNLELNTLKPKTLNPKPPNPKTLKPKTLNPKPPKPQNPTPLKTLQGPGTLDSKPQSLNALKAGLEFRVLGFRVVEGLGFEGVGFRV